MDKIMEVPDKLYITTLEKGKHYYTEGIPFEREYIEYVRSDIFIDKACKWLKQNMINNLAFQDRLERMNIIDRIVCNFKKAIES